MLKARPLIAAILGAMLLLTACSKGKESTKKEEPQPEAPKVITLTVVTGRYPGVDALLSAYQEARPGVRLTILKPDGSGDRWSAMRDAKVKEGEVDVVLARQFSDVAAGLLLPLDSYIQKTNLDLRPFGPWLEQWRHEGRLYYLPEAAYPVVILYSKELFKQAGVPEPTSGWTWEQFRETAGRVASGEGDQRVWGYQPFEAHKMLQFWLESETGKPWWQADQKAITKGLTLFRTMVQTDRSMAPIAAVNWDRPVIDRDEKWEQKKVAMVSLGGTEVANMMESPPFPVGVVSFPVAPGGKPFVPVQPNAYGIAAASKQADAAWDLLKFLVGPEGAKINAANGIVPTYLTEDAEKAWFAREPRPGKETDVLFRAERIYPPPFMSPPFRLDYTFGKMANKALSGSSALEDAVAEYVKLQEKVLSEVKVKP